VPDLLSDIIWCDLSGNQDEENEWRKLCKVLDGKWDGYKEIEELVRNAIDAEFSACKTLPDIKLEMIEGYFDINGGAYRRIKNILRQHQSKSWVISNKDNPSTYFLLDIRVTQKSKSEFQVYTKEYFYLRWFSLNENKYCHIYNETNDQIYVVKKIAGSYKIVENIYPSPNNIISRFMNFLMKRIKT